MARRKKMIEMPPEAAELTRDMRERYEAGKGKASMSARNRSNAVLSRESLDQLREEVTPTDAAGRAYAQSGNVPMTLVMGGLKAAETFGTAEKSGQGVQKNPYLRTDGPPRYIIPDTPFILGRDVPLDRAYRDFVDGGNGKPRGLSAPSMYALPYDKGFHEEGGYRGKGIDPAVSVAYMMNPEMFRAGPKSQTLWYGKDAATGTSKELGVRMLKHLPNSETEIATTEAVRKLLAKNPDRFRKYVSGTEDPKTATERDAAHFIGALMNIMTGPGAGGSSIPATERTSLHSMRRKGDMSFANAYPFLAPSRSIRLLDSAGITPRQLAEAYEYWSAAGVYDPDIKWFADNFATNPRDLEILNRRNFSKAVEAVSRSNRRGFSLDYKSTDGKITDIPVVGARELDDTSLTEKMGDILGYVMMNRENGHPDTFAEAKSFSTVQPDRLSSAVPAAFLRINRPLNLADPKTVEMVEALEAQWEKMGIPHLRAYTPEYGKWVDKDWSTVDPKLRSPDVNLGYKERPNPLQDDLGFRPTPEEAQIILGTRLAAKGGDTRADTGGGKASKMSEEQRVAHVNAGIAKHPGFSEGDVEDMRKSAAFIADPKNAIRGLLVEGTLKHDAERPVFYSRNDWEGGQDGFQGDRFSMASSLDDGRVVVFPSIYADKDGVTRLHTGKDAFDHYQESGEHFGIYDSVENANRAAEWSHHAGNAGWLKRREKQQDAKGGDAPGASAETPPSGPAPEQPQGGPRIVINPTTFRNQKDALCVAFNEGFRLWMEANDFQPQSEPTDEQRRFFSDTAYADDELQLRRTILARIATFDTSVKDPTDDQISETAQFLGAILASDWCKNEWERDCVSRLANAANAAVGAEPARPRREPLRAREAEPLRAANPL